ncbi:MATE family efflux transporter [Paenibacillus antri]|uniref:MATE family efflux transporter n=1 Tax=Paenibacillus antri TaxID=2582848 RepID=A0A5R9G1Q2_9BACL|nr:MATE family efflux transporter [Paenibacillus antri]TLS48939.1 MATE family efflux transporter [Paenibacillus antri]
MTGTAEAPAGRPGRSKDLNLFWLTWPIFLEISLFMMMGSADTLMLSAVSDDAVSAVGVANQFVFIAILIMEVVANGAAIVVAQYLGARRPEEAAKIAGLAITLNLGLGLAVSAAFLGFGDSLLRAANLHGAVLADAQTYLGIVGGWLVLQALINTMAGLVRTYGFTRESMFVTLGMNVLHVALNYALIFGHWGAPELGVAGAAISTVISRGAAVLVFFWLLYRVMEVRIRLRDYVTMSKAYLSSILKLGVPSGLEQVTYHACQSVFLYYVTFLGAAELASRQYATNITAYIFLFCAALGMGTAIVVGRLVGAGRQEDAYGRVWRSLKWGLAVTMLVCAVVVAFRGSIAGLFTDDAAIVALVSQVILVSLLLEPGRCFNLILINALRAAGDAKITVYMGFVSMVGISLPLGYYLTFEAGLGLVGVFLAIAADEWIRGIAMWFRWRSRAWEGKALVAPPVPEAGQAATV